MMGSFRFCFGLVSLSDFVKMGRSGSGHIYLVGTLVRPLSQRCFTPLWYFLFSSSTTRAVIDGDILLCCTANYEVLLPRIYIHHAINIYRELIIEREFK